MAESTYRKDKVYLSREVRQKLGLVDGDVLPTGVVEKGVARLSMARGSGATRKVLAKLDHPPDLGKVRGRLSREEIYEDIP